jgi:hypothetical protein
MHPATDSTYNRAMAVSLAKDPEVQEELVLVKIAALFQRLPTTLALPWTKCEKPSCALVPFFVEVSTKQSILVMDAGLA